MHHYRQALIVIKMNKISLKFIVNAKDCAARKKSFSKTGLAPLPTVTIILYGSGIASPNCKTWKLWLMQVHCTHLQYIKVSSRLSCPDFL